MGTIRRWQSAGFVETHLSGVVTPELATRWLEELSRPKEGDSLFELVLHEDQALFDLDYESGHVITARVRAFLDSLRTGAIAFVAPTAASYGRCRQFQVRIESERVEVEVFHRNDEAKAWLDEKCAGAVRTTTI